MSSNLDLVRSLFENWERPDFDWADPHIDFVVVDGPTPGRWHGIPEAMRGLSDYLSAWEGYHVTPEQYRELDGERILVMTRERATGKMSGIDAEHLRANLLHLHRGGVTRMTLYWDRNRAVADLGLAPEGRAADQSD
jgi:hypothetical protein